MKDQKNIPALRFPEFNGEWKNKKLGEIAEKIQDGTHFSPVVIEEGHYKYITSKNIRNGYMDLSDISYISDIAHREIYRRCDVRLNDVLITKDGASVGNVCLNELNEEFSLLSSVAFIRANKAISQNDYIYQYIVSPTGQKEIQSFVSGQAITRITLTKLNCFNISFPTLPEQKKIASFLTSVDTRLTQLKQKKNFLEQYKKGVMQKLFSREIRFRYDEGMEFPEWEEKILGDLVDYEQPTKYLVESTEYNESFKTPVLTAGKTFILGYTDETNGIFENNLPVIIFDDFTTATQFVDFPFKAKSSAMKILLPKVGVNIKFIYEAIQVIKYEIGGHERHWISKYSKIPILLPSYVEQTKIANFLFSLDEKINQCKSQIEKTEQWKKGLLQQMFC